MSGRNFARSAWKKYGFKEMDGHPAPFRRFGNRIKTVSDRVLAMKHSRLIEDGTHAELLSRGGEDAELWQLQASQYGPVEAEGEQDPARPTTP